MSMRSRSSQIQLTVLEGREVPAGISLNTTNSQLLITGDASDDFVQVRYPTSTQYVNQLPTQVADRTIVEATVITTNGYRQTISFNAASVKTILLNAKGGSDVFLNSTGLPSTWTTSNGGIVNGSLLPGSPLNNNTSDQSDLGVLVVGDSGGVEVDYLFCGAGYRAQLGFYLLEGLESLTPGSAEYIKEAARRVLSNSDQGKLVVDRNLEGARYTASLPWEGNLNSGPYLGPKQFQLKPNGRYGAILVPNGNFNQVYNNPSITGDKRPLFSIPAANPYIITPQLLGQMGDLTNTGSIFAFEDLRLDASSDQDYNDVVFQVTGARGLATPIREVVNVSRDFTQTTVGKTLTEYGLQRQSQDPTSTGNFRSGVFSVGSAGRVGLDFLFDGGGYVSQMGVFSLQGMDQYTPGSPEFVREAARRILSGTNLGSVLIDDFTEGARIGTSNEPLLKSFNQGQYRGIKVANLTPGDRVGLMMIPNGNFWEAFSNPTASGAKRAIFSMPEANPSQKDQFAAVNPSGDVFAFEDVLIDGSSISPSDRDYNDVVFRIYGMTPIVAPPRLSSIAAVGRDWTPTLLGIEVAQTVSDWS